MANDKRDWREGEWRQREWRKSLVVLGILLPVWFAASFGCGILFVEPLNEYELAGYPLGFWFAHQGSIYIFVGLILVYALIMDRLDNEDIEHELEESRSADSSGETP